VTRVEDSARGTAGSDGRRFGGHRLDRFQEEAIDAIEAGHDIVVAAPTGAGKTLIAEYAVQQALTLGRQVVYTAPIKALSNQKFRDFRRGAGGPDSVGLMTGDVVLNPGAPLVIMTTEIFRNTIFDDPTRVESVQSVVFDEIHFLDDLERGTVWEESLIFAPPRLQIIALSATIPNLDTFVEWLAWVRGRTVVPIQTTERPVPLVHRFFLPEVGMVEARHLRGACERATRRRQRGARRWQADRHRGREEARNLGKVLDHVTDAGELPCLVFSFSRNACEAHARDACERDLLADGTARRQILRLYDDLCARYGLAEDGRAQDLRRLVARGIAYHHAGMLPALKEVVERLFTTGQLLLIFTTETFAVGINMPARSVVFTSLRKYDGRSFRTLRTRDYFQMAGRAGRRGIDTEGAVHAVVDLEDVAPRELRRLVAGGYEPVVSRFDLSYASILNLWERLGGKVFTAVERSFGAFRAPAREQKGLQRRLRARLQVLRETGYLEGSGLTKKGKVAASIFGYEIPLAELLHAGVLERLEAKLLAVVLASLAFEPRRGDWFKHADRRRYTKLYREISARLEPFQLAERRAGLTDPVPSPDQRFAPVAMAWMRGRDLEDLERYTSADQGDLVRVLRGANQMLRNLAKLAGRLGHGDFGERIERARSLLNRQEVDAEAQLAVP
jgi:superfamily II RNA helicase